MGRIGRGSGGGVFQGKGSRGIDLKIAVKTGVKMRVKFCMRINKKSSWAL
jgi:hypothetical protein